MNSCTRHAFTDGACRNIKGGCRGCPGKFPNEAFSATPSQKAWERVAIVLPLAVLSIWAIIWLGAQAWEGMERREASYQSDLRR